MYCLSLQISVATYAEIIVIRYSTLISSIMNQKLARLPFSRFEGQQDQLRICRWRSSAPESCPGIYFVQSEQFAAP